MFLGTSRINQSRKDTVSPHMLKQPVKTVLKVSSYSGRIWEDKGILLFEWRNIRGIWERNGNFFFKSRKEVNTLAYCLPSGSEMDAVVSFPATWICWLDSRQKSSECIANFSLPAEGDSGVLSTNSCSETSSLCSRSEGECREAPLGQKDLCMCVCLSARESARNGRQIYRRRGGEAEWREESRAAGYIRSYPLNRGATWIG